MYLHLGQDTTILSASILGIFDLDNTSQSKYTRAFLAQEEKQRHVINVSEELPRSFLVCQENGVTRVYLSQLSSATLQRRVSEGTTQKF